MLTNKELKQITGGGLAASYIAAIVRGISAVADLGRALGTAIRRLSTGKLC